MTEIVNNNKACCSLPPVEVEYTPKGSYETIEGVNTYVAGPKDSKKLVIYVPDIFGFSAQALQGSDLIAAGSNVRVWFPDFFHGTKVEHSLFQPPQTAEKGATIQQLFSGVANPATNLVVFQKIIAFARSSGFEKIGAIGFCWGAKMTFMSTGLDAKAGIHPSLLTAQDADDITVPTALWPSMNENMEIMNALNEVLKKKPFADKNVFYHFSESIHGFAAARANLKDEGEKAVFVDSFQRITKFFTNVL